LVSGTAVDGHVLEGLRTEMPFHIALPADLEGMVRHRWSPDGPEPLTLLDEATVEMSGVIDLVLCTRTPEASTIRPIDLKTEEAGRMHGGDS